MKPPSETKLREVERELRQLPAGAQRAVGGGVYMRLNGESRRRFTHRPLKGRPGGTADTWQLRTDLFHVKPGRLAPQLIADADDLGRRLEPLVIADLCSLLGGSDEGLAEGVTTAHPVEVILDATIDGDPAEWDTTSTRTWLSSMN